MITPNRVDAFIAVMVENASDTWAGGPEEKQLFWTISYKKSHPPFKFFIEHDEDMLYIQYIFSDFRPRYVCWPALYRVLLRINDELPLVKFGLTPRGNVALMGELPAEQFSLDVFRNLLLLMVASLEDLFWELETVSRTESLSPLLTLSETLAGYWEQDRSTLIRTISSEEV